MGTFVAKALLDSRIIDLPLGPVFMEMVIKGKGFSDPLFFGGHSVRNSKNTSFHLIKVFDMINFIILYFAFDWVLLFYSSKPSLLFFSFLFSIYPIQKYMKHVDSTIYKSLLDLQYYANAKQDILNNTTLSVQEQEDLISKITFKNARLEDLCLDFTLPGYPFIELIPQGKDMIVTMDRIEEYIHKVVDMTVGIGIERQVNEFRKGFDRVFPVEDLKSFSVEELSVLVGGMAEEDWSIESK